MCLKPLHSTVHDGKGFVNTKIRFSSINVFVYCLVSEAQHCEPINEPIHTDYSKLSNTWSVNK